jgi:DNA-binding LacI/PurR family transcriptional regulator
MNRPTTINDIATHVGVSNTAVSAVLGQTNSTHVRVSEQTRGRILEAARALCYRPNRIARSLRSRQTNVIGVYTAHGYLSPHVAFTSQIIGGLHLGCDQQHKDLLLHGTYPGRSADAIYDELADGRIDGLILYTSPQDPLVERLTASSLPVVAIVDALPGLPSVVADDGAGSRLLAAHLARQGHRRIFYRPGDIILTSAVCRQQAFEEAAVELGLTITEYCSRAQREVIPASELTWLERPRDQRPTAAVCWNDVSAYCLLEYCRHHGVRVPEDLAVVGFDDIAPPHGNPLRLTTIRAPWVDVAAQAVALLVRRMEGHAIPEQTVLPVELVIGDTA